jgi:hypothetical protein
VNYLKLLAGLVIGIGFMLSGAGFANPVLGPFETTQGLSVTVELQTAPSGEAVAAEPIIRVTGLAPTKPITGFVILPNQENSIETVPSVPLQFAHDGQDWVGRIVSTEVSAGLPAATNGQLHNGYGLMLIVQGRAVQFRNPSERRMHPAILGLRIGDAVRVENACALRTLLNAP